MPLLPKQSRMISDLGIFPRSISKVGNHFIGHNSRAAYVQHKGDIQEICPGDIIQHESVSADVVERISGLNFAGTRDDNKTVFMSTSNAIHVELSPEKRESVCYDMQTALSAAMDYAKNSQRIHDILDMCSESATPKYLKYVGSKITVDDASDEYDLVLEKGDLVKLTYLNKDRYDLRLKDSPRIQFIVRGHEVAQNIMGALEFTAPFGQISDQKTNKFEYVGEISKKLSKPTIAKGTVVLTSRKKHYLAHNLAVPIESWMNSQTLHDVLNHIKAGKEPVSYVKGKAIKTSPKIAPMGQAEPLPKLANPKKLSSAGQPKKVATVYGAFFPVSASTPNRSRVVFADTPAKLQSLVRDIIATYNSPVDYSLFTTLSTDENYKAASKNKVVIKTTPIIASTYHVTQTVKMAPAVLHPTFVEPKTGVPSIDFPVYEGQEQKVIEFFRRQIEEGYFNTGVRLSHPQPDTGIRFSAPIIDDVIYDQIIGVARRIAAYLIHEGVPLKKSAITLARGKKAAEIRFHLPKVTAEQKASIDKLVSDYPTLNAPIYETIKPKQPTVEILSVDIHTGKVTARAQRGPSLFGNPFDVLYSNVKRKNF